MSRSCSACPFPARTASAWLRSVGSLQPRLGCDVSTGSPGVGVSVVKVNPMRVACWNPKWHRATSQKGTIIQTCLLTAGAEIICCPEAHEDFLPEEWHGIFSRPDSGYPMKPGRRRVTLWSRQPWREVDDLGSADLPPGGFVRATTQTSLGPVHVIGVCTPWPAAHVLNGRRDRQWWEEHMLYLRALKPLLEHTGGPTILIGDFNQTMPQRWAPAGAYEQLLATFGQLEVWTKGNIAGLDDLTLCHIAGSLHLAPTHVAGYSRWHNRKALSDHDGIAVDLELRHPAQRIGAD